MFDPAKYHLALSGDDPKSLPQDSNENKTIWIIVFVIGILLLCSLPWGVYKIAFAKPPDPTATATMQASQLEASPTATATPTATQTPTPSDTPTASPTPTKPPTQTPRIVTQIVEVEATRQVFIVKTVEVPQPILITVVVTATQTYTPTPTASPTITETPGPTDSPTLTETSEAAND